MIAVIAGIVLVGAAAGAWFLMQSGGQSAGDQAPAPVVKPTSAAKAVSSTGPTGTLVYGQAKDLDIIEPPPFPVPPKGVFLNVTYLGSYTGSYTVNGNTMPIKNSGPHQFEIEDPKGSISATVRKNEPSTQLEMIVELIRDGQKVNSGSSKEPYGEVSIGMNV
jgi:hypothetical protein